MKSLSKTTAPKEDRIYGSKTNPKGSASSEKSAKEIKLSTDIIVSLTKKLKEFKLEHPNNKNVGLSDLKAVYRRGLGAYSSTHRPTISGGKPNTRNAWAMARVNAFLRKAGGGEHKKAYVQDDDLLKYDLGGDIRNHYDKEKIKGANEIEYQNLIKYGLRYDEDFLEKLSPQEKSIWLKLQDLDFENMPINLPIKNIPIEDIIFSQSDVGINIIEKNKHKIGLPICIKKDGNIYVISGNHRLFSQLIKDKKNNIKCYLKDFDENKYANGGELKEYYQRTYADGTIQKISIEDYEKNVLPNLGNGGALYLAPNGKETNLTPEQYKLVRTPEFKAWFGDFENNPEGSSKVVDENGEPLVMYHGTKSSFNKFKKQNTYFTNSKKYIKNLIGQDFEIKEVFLNSKKVCDLTKFGTREISFKNFSNECIKQGANKEYASFEELEDFVSQNKYMLWQYFRSDDTYLSDMATDWLSYFFDMIIYENSGVYGSKSKTMLFISNRKNKLPNQIKLADGTNTTFDSENPDIRYEGGGEVDKHKETYAKWKSLVNMSKSELEMFYNSEEGKVAGLKPSEASAQGIDSGRESARWIMKMKDTNVSDWTPQMWKWANKQISFISRMSGMRGGLYDEKGNKTRKHLSLLIWGHNPEKKNNGDMISNTFEQGGEVDDCINYIKYNQTIFENGYYFDMNDLSKVIDPYGQVPLNLDFTLVSYNSGGQNNLDVIDTINPTILVDKLSELLDLAKNQSYVVVHYVIDKAKRLTNIQQIKTEKIVIVDRDKIICENLNNLKDGGEIPNEIIELLKESKYLNDKSNELSLKLNEISNREDRPMGLVSENIRQSDDFKKAKIEFDNAFQRLRQFNSSPKGKQLQKYLSKLDMMQRMKIKKMNFANGGEIKIKKVRTLEDAKKDPRVENIYFEPHDYRQKSGSWWLELKEGYICKSMSCGTIHEDTLKDVLDLLNTDVVEESKYANGGETDDEQYFIAICNYVGFLPNVKDYDTEKHYRLSDAFDSLFDYMNSEDALNWMSKEGCFFSIERLYYKGNEQVGKVMYKITGKEALKLRNKRMLEKGGTFAKGGIIGSSPTLDGIKKMIGNYYYSSNISLQKINDTDEYEVHNAKGKINSVKVIYKKGRFQFVNVMSNGGTINQSINTNYMDEIKFNQLPHIDTLKNGDKILIRESVFVGDMEKPKHKGDRYVHCQVMGSGGMTNSLNLKVLNSVGTNAIRVGQGIVRPISNVLSNGRKMIVEPISKATSVGINDLYKGDIISYKGNKYEVGGVTSCMSRVKCNGVDTSKEEEFDIEDFMDNSTLINRK
jgi:hypothetical protein